MKKNNFFGYLLGLLIFVFLLPAGMWLIAGEVHPGWFQVICFVLLAATGIGLSVRTIVYMRLVGRGNPMDAFNHEVAPRTQALMTEGPYRLCRNPMLLGVIIYYIGLLILLLSWKAAAVFAIFISIMMIQVQSEEKRLERDFGEEYLTYKSKTRRFIPYFR